MKTIQLITLLVAVLITNTANAQTNTIFYYPKLPQVSISEVKTNLTRLLQKISVVRTIGDTRNNTKTFYGPTSIKGARVYDDKMEIYLQMDINSKSNTTLNFDFLQVLPIKIAVKKCPPIPGTKEEFSYAIVLDFLNFTLYGRNADEAMEIADYLYFFQQRLNIQPLQEQLDSALVKWKPIAAQYCALKVKPPVTEEQRKYIVQADSFTEEKQFSKAIELYRKAIDIDHSSFPAAYYNLALLYGQIRSFDIAVFYMKIYLMFVPESPDARSAQDKIYEWEARIIQ